ncbi:hypothetical protein GGR51DRAFT_320612 [Nemania sp. FL0031]|nr:hypothetical protein GGR51DRAFT_320612 [Nemania sp. FL0031]
MRGQPPSGAPEKKLLEGKQGELFMKEIWAEAAKSFEDICGKSLQNGDLKSFDDVRAKIESASKAGADDDDGLDAGGWDKAKNIGLESLKYLKLLLGAASQASSFIPLPSSAVSITTNALFFVFDIPQAIRDYDDAINEVFGKVSSALSKFKIYESMDSENIDLELIDNLRRVMISFVKLCAHVVKYKQGRKRDRFKHKAKKSILDDDSGLAGEMAEFELAVQQTHDIEGTITLAAVIDSRQDIKIILERCISFGKVAEETQKGVQSLGADADRIKTLVKIRDTLNVLPTVLLDTKTTQTCSDIYRKCLDGTGSWIWRHPAYRTWTATNDKDASHLLLLSGSSSSGKTLASSQITKKLEGLLQERKFVSHYFFPTSAKKSDDEKNPVQSALKYMAFQIARVDNTVQKALGKACDANPGAFRSSSSLENLWGELKIGSLGSGAWYYFVLDGLENLPDDQAEMLLKFLLSPRMTGESTRRVRFLLSGTSSTFSSLSDSEVKKTPQVRMEEHNIADMHTIIDNALDNQEMLKNAKPNSNQQKAKDLILKKMPENAKGSYYRLKLELEEAIRLLSTRRTLDELEDMLDQTASSHEVAIKKLQRSLTAEEIGEVNELLKWVLFSKSPMTLDQLEAAMFLYSGTESLASLQYIIKNKYSAVLRLEGTNVYAHDGIKEYLSKEKDAQGESLHPEERPTISMTITINNVDQEICGHFLWDLAHKAIRDKFKFEFDANSNSLHNNQVTIGVDEFEAHHTIVLRAFKYLSKEPGDQTSGIGEYLIRWLPHHLKCLYDLEDDQRELTADKKLEIGRNLFNLFEDEQSFKRHRKIFEETFWTADEMEDIRKWLLDSAVVRRLNKKWRDKVQAVVSPTRGYLNKFVKIVVTGLLRDRSWDARNASNWIMQFMIADGTTPQAFKPIEASADDDTSPSNSPPSLISDNAEIDWDRFSTWCQDFLGSESMLDSLWYERLATVASLRGSPVYVRSLYKRALEKENPSWMCHRGLGEAYFSQDQTQDALKEIEEALRLAREEGAAPKPKPRDLVYLHLLLGRFNYVAGDVETAADHFLFTLHGEDAQHAALGQLGYLESILNFSDIKIRRELLKNALDLYGGEEKFVRLLRMIARDMSHEEIIPKMFATAEEVPGLLRGIVHAMERATLATLADDQITEIFGDEHFIEDECRGVLLYYMGVAAYRYKVLPEETDPAAEALKLWTKSRDILANVGGRNAFLVRQSATTALSKYYFQSMLDDQHLDHLDALSKLAEDESEIFLSDSAGFLGAIYAIRNKEEQSKSALRKRMRRALQILSDDTPENDFAGLLILQKTLDQHQDFDNSAIALSLMAQADILTQWLVFEAKDIDDESGIDKQQVLEILTKVVKDTIREAKSQFPDSSQQTERINAAQTYVDSLAAIKESKPILGARGDDVVEEPNGEDGGEGKLPSVDPKTAAALHVLRERIAALQKEHSPEINTKVLNRIWRCDGRDSAGNPCKNEHDFKINFYNCIYCANQDFCGDCIKRLCDPESEIEITACSDKHRWLRIPPLGDDVYAGSAAKSVRVPKVRPSEEDMKILDIYYGDDSEEITVEAWKEKLATEWGMSIAELRQQAVGKATYPGGSEENKSENSEESEESEHE